MENKKDSKKNSMGIKDQLESSLILNDDDNQRESANPLGEDLRLTHKSVNQLQKSPRTEGNNEESTKDAVRNTRRTIDAAKNINSPTSDKANS